MARGLQPDDVLRQRGAVELSELPDGHLLVRTRVGASVLPRVEDGGFASRDVERVLAVVDGKRTAEEICALLATGIDGRKLSWHWNGAFTLLAFGAVVLCLFAVTRMS